MKVENDVIDVPQPQKKVREGWAEASRAIAEAGDDSLVMGEFANEDDKDLTY
ncbi:hypothetical protein [Paraburkholderia sp. DHOC27]|uniref:hypothetical protein n=1 Tax=Paraburkholderia sp. DHOC27 TaxID=2303330 RepID=UPI0015F343E5|nr:hypothetical protein [Paraburkholderia sp. DHOC27]